MTEEKINELKKLIGFGFFIINRIRKSGAIKYDIDNTILSNVLSGKLSIDSLTPMIVQSACVYNHTFLEEKVIESFSKETTKLLEQLDAEYIEFSKRYEKTKLGSNN